MVMFSKLVSVPGSLLRKALLAHRDPLFPCTFFLGKSTKEQARAAQCHMFSQLVCSLRLKPQFQLIEMVIIKQTHFSRSSALLELSFFRCLNIFFWTIKN